jgi:DNA-binding transcriptional ArsR family regulator
MVRARISPANRETPRRPAQSRSARTVRSAGQAVDLDRVIHERMRLAIVSALAANVTLSFRDLKALLRATDGNLSVHARKLEDAGYVACTKSFEGRVPKTEYRLTAGGRSAFERYLNHLEALVRSARGRS